MLMYLKLFWVFLQIGALSFGGGYAAMPLVEEQVVEEQQWMTMEEFADIVTIDELTPGPVAINTATFVGYRMAGVGGAIAATLGNITPSCILALIFAKLYYKYRSLSIIDGALSGLRCMVVALIATTALSILKNALFNSLILPNFLCQGMAAILFVGALLVLRKWEVSPLLVMLGCGVIGLLVYPILGQVQL